MPECETTWSRGLTEVKAIAVLSAPMIRQNCHQNLACQASIWQENQRLLGLLQNRLAGINATAGIPFKTWARYGKSRLIPLLEHWNTRALQHLAREAINCREIIPNDRLPAGSSAGGIYGWLAVRTVRLSFLGKAQENAVALLFAVTRARSPHLLWSPPQRRNENIRLCIT